MKLGLIFLRETGGMDIPIGITSIATYLMKHMEIEIQIIDINFENVEKTAIEGNFDIIGISAMTVEYGKAITIAKKMKKDIDVPIIIGGPHISTLPTSLKPCFDLGVLGEGEDTMLELMRLYEKNRQFDEHELQNIRGIAFYVDDRFVLTGKRNLIANLDDIPQIDRTLVNKHYFRYREITTWGEFGIYGSMLTARGCPYKCTFCSTTQFWDKMRYHSTERVVAEIQELIEKYGATHIHLWDDLFTINKKRLREIAHLLKKKELIPKVKFVCQPRANLIDDELCEILRDMNVCIAMFGFESGNEKILQFLKGGSVTVEQNRKAVSLCIKHGLRVQGSLILGSPGETFQDMEDTLKFIKFAIKEGAERIWCFILTPFPATRVWEIAKQRGKVSDDMDWNLLSHQNVENPLLLDPDINMEDFKRIFFQCRARMDYFKWKKLFHALKHNTLSTIKLGITRPIYSLRILFSRKIF